MAALPLAEMAALVVVGPRGALQLLGKVITAAAAAAAEHMDAEAVVAQVRLDKPRRGVELHQVMAARGLALAFRGPLKLTALAAAALGGAQEQRRAPAEPTQAAVHRAPAVDRERPIMAAAAAAARVLFLAQIRSAVTVAPASSLSVT
jgi:hypothetical protein